MKEARSRFESAVTGLWGPRIIWLIIGVAGAWSIGESLDSRSSLVRTTVTFCAWILWGAGVVALMVPSTLGLTVMRMLVALACGTAITSWADGASSAAGASFVACALIGAMLVGSADFGTECVQSSAYGDERRFLLRPPAAFLPPVVLAGLLWVATAIAAPLLLGARQWVVGLVVAAAAALLTVALIPRFNTLSGRWLVMVPAGVVVHDEVVLGETFMVARADIVDIELALEDTEAADLTGPAGGHAVEIRLRSMATVVLAPDKESPRGRALHVRSFIVTPSRPGAVLRYWTMPPPRT
ncbi:MAG TPA: hypothetical protein VGC84_09415 [Ilumatobacteraceae bacterium]